MYTTPEQDLKDYKRASAKLMREIGGNQQKAIAHLIKAGILEKHAGSKQGVRLTKPYRSAS